MSRECSLAFATPRSASGRMSTNFAPPRQSSKGITFFGRWISGILQNRPHRCFPAPDTRRIINGVIIYCSRSISAVIRRSERISEPNPSIRRRLPPPAAEVGLHGPGGILWGDFSPCAAVQARGGPRNARESSSDGLRIVTRGTTTLPLESALKSWTVGTHLGGGAAI